MSEQGGDEKIQVLYVYRTGTWRVKSWTSLEYPPPPKKKNK